MKLTTKSVDKLVLPPGKSEAFFWDDDVPGFGCRLRDTGALSVTFVFQYRIGRRQRRLTLGAASALSAPAARAMAVTVYAKVKLGHDPAGEKDKAAAVQGDTFEATLQPYLARQRQRLRPRSMVEITRRLVVNAGSLHRMPLTAIGRRDIAKLAARLSATSGPVTANCTIASLSAFFAYCVRDGLCDANPAAFVNKLPQAARERVLSLDELAKVWRATEGDDSYSTIVKLLLLLGCRRQEIGALTWKEIDLDAALIRLPSERVKNGRAREIPLSAPALEILASLEPRGDRGFVFGRRGFTNWAGAKAALDRRAQLATPWVLHDLRRAISTHLNNLGVAPHVVESILGHHVGGVASVYNKAGYVSERRKALDRWAAIVEGRESSKVVALRA